MYQQASVLNVHQSQNTDAARQVNKNCRFSVIFMQLQKNQEQNSKRSFIMVKKLFEKNST